jgi:hypothetical protein
MFPNQPTFGGGGFNNFLGAGITSFLWVVALVAIAIVVWRERKGNLLARLPLTKLALKRFRVNDQNDSRPALEVVGRASGLISWVFALLRLEPEFHLIVGSVDASLQAASLSGISHICVPLEKVDSTNCGYRRSILALAIAMFCASGFVLTFLSGFLENNSNSFGSDMGLAFGWLILAGIAALFFFFSKKVAFALCCGTHCYGFTFKRSVIENVSVDLPLAMKAIAAINGRVLAVQPISGNSTGQAVAAAAHASSCPKCSAVNSAGLRFCESCGFTLA